MFKVAEDLTTTMLQNVTTGDIEYGIGVEGVPGGTTRVYSVMPANNALSRIDCTDTTVTGIWNNDNLGRGDDFDFSNVWIGDVFVDSQGNVYVAYGSTQAG